ncbi:hypothetical protein BSIN_4564 [Burkholderia singularis]|uniref:Uncharacterized protein n=1 Tax=Burkholderia singularis TaxID=1503053 RepID=A0A238HCR3_9BURK|nr:hypothetical protein BSIN_4564 [Burkholderia singularis]
MKSVLRECEDRASRRLSHIGKQQARPCAGSHPAQPAAGARRSWLGA